MSTVRIWDLPVRLFHWCFAACVLGAYLCAKVGDPYMAWHVRFGLTALGLIIFRVLWGFIGPYHARFGSFVRGPSDVRDYLRALAAGTARSAGHNPLGALSVLAMLADVGIQCVLGLFANDDVSTQGPLYRFVSDDTSSLLTSLHVANQRILVALVVLHVLAVVWHTLVKKEPLVRAMVTGDMPGEGLPEDVQVTDDSVGMRLRALVLAAAVAALVLWIRSLGGSS